MIFYIKKILERHKSVLWFFSIKLSVLQRLMSGSCLIEIGICKLTSKPISLSLFNKALQIFMMIENHPFKAASDLLLPQSLTSCSPNATLFQMHCLWFDSLLFQSRGHKEGKAKRDPSPPWMQDLFGSGLSSFRWLCNPSPWTAKTFA